MSRCNALCIIRVDRMTKVLNHTEEPLCTLATFMMDDFTFPIFNFSLNSSNIPASPADGAYISQLIRYSRACAQYRDFLNRAQLPMQKATPARLCYSYKVIATNILQSSSQSGWPLRNIHISNDNGCFIFYVDVFFPLSLPMHLPELTVYTSNTVGVL